MTFTDWLINIALVAPLPTTRNAANAHEQDATGGPPQ